jgi:hypothetical protein
LAKNRVERAVNSNPSRGKLQLRSTFPGKPLIKTYVSLWQSCRSTTPLQLLFLENFDLVDTFRSYAISKQGKWNRARPVSRRRCALAPAARDSTACHASSAHSSGVRTLRRLRYGPSLCLVPSASPLGSCTVRAGRGPNRATRRCALRARASHACTPLSWPRARLDDLLASPRSCRRRARQKRQGPTLFCTPPVPPPFSNGRRRRLALC